MITSILKPGLKTYRLNASCRKRKIGEVYQENFLKNIHDISGLYQNSYCPKTLVSQSINLAYILIGKTLIKKKKKNLFTENKNVNAHSKYKILDVQLKAFFHVYSSRYVYIWNLSEFILKQMTSPAFTERIQVLSCLQLLIEPVCCRISFLSK